MTTFELLVYFDIISFLFFGITCIFSKHMVSEFLRFGLSNLQRVITGILQLIAVVGLYLGLNDPLIGLVAATGLAVLMLLGFMVRLKISDGIYKSSPALIYTVLNTILAYKFYAITF
jgi:hypothetical protein